MIILSQARHQRGSFLTNAQGNRKSTIGLWEKGRRMGYCLGSVWMKIMRVFLPVVTLMWVSLSVRAEGAANVALDDTADAVEGIQCVAEAKIGAAPHGSYIDDDTLYVALSGDDAIVGLDKNTLQEKFRWRVPGVPLDIIKMGDDWLVTAFDSNELIEIKGDTGKLGRRWKVGKGPSLFAPRVIDDKAYVVSEFADQFTVFNLQTQEVEATYQTGNRPYPADVTRDGVLAFIPNRGDNSVTILDLLSKKAVATTKVCSKPEGGALAADDTIYFVACGGDNKVMLINTASFDVIKTVEQGIGERPFAVTVSDDGQFAFVNNAGGETLSVIDTETRQVVRAIKVGEQPIVMRTKGRSLYVTNEVSGTVSKLMLPPPKRRTKAGIKNEVIMLGMIHSGHNSSDKYSLPFLTRLIREINPDYVFTEIPPNRLEAAIKGYAQTGELTEPRVRRFAEYIGSLFPLTKEMDFEIVPTAGWNSFMAGYRRDALRRIENDPARKADWSEYQAANAWMDQMIGARGDDPYFIHTDEYDAITRKGLEPYDRLFNDELGTGGWATINQAHYGLINAALDKYSLEGKRILITFGAGHKYWFLEQLRKRNDIVLLPVEPFLDAAGGTAFKSSPQEGNE
jgi:YVTN family beta-propeller protein